VSRFRTARVVEVTSERRGLQRLQVDPGAGPVPAFVLTELVGRCEVGDRVVVNTTAVELGLGTGGDHVVHWNLERDSLAEPGADHVLKLRYTSLQFEAGTSELDHPECDRPLDGAPVVACTLHSHLVPVVAGVHAVDPGLRVVYVQTDGGALPVALSDDVDRLRASGGLTGTVSAGHAFGGDLEALTVASGLALAVHTLGADVVVAGVGPGVAGTGTANGSTALDAVGVVDLAAATGGRPVLCARLSEADPRDRHRGLSHHTRRVADLTHARALVARSPGLPEALDGVEVVDLPPEDRPTTAVVPSGHRIMGRGPDEDPVAFEAAVAAGVLAARLAGTR